MQNEQLMVDAMNANYTSKIDKIDNSGYSVENAIKFAWGSVRGDLDAERVAILEKYVVGKIVLDAGCGGGGYVDFLVKNGFEASGVDKFGEFLNMAKERSLQGTFHQADIADMPFENKAFDTTICFDVLEHVDDIEAIKELARVTRKRIIVSVPSEANEHLLSSGLTNFSYVDLTHLRYYNKGLLLHLAETVSPSNVEIFSTNTINFGFAVHKMLSKQGETPPFPQIKDSDHSWANKVLKRKILNFILRHPAVAGMYKGLYTSKETYPEMKSDLTCVIDL